MDHPEFPNPFPGLRSYGREDADRFYGRRQAIGELLGRLQHQRFVAVVGPSGSGKSSLVKAGLTPHLSTGGRASSGRGWWLATMRPGDDPIGRLSHALDEVFVPYEEEKNEPAEPSYEPRKFRQLTLRRGPAGLVEAAAQGPMAEGDRLLVLVDQFEEIFRFERAIEGEGKYADDRAAFVKLILAASQQQRVPIYVLLTMRADHFGDCVRFRDLPEAINDGQYLVPRMRRQQLQQVITEPIRQAGATITPALVQKLLADVGEDPLKLPLLQHCLSRLWVEWLRRVGDDPAGEPAAIALVDYRAIGRLKEALSRHADTVWKHLSGQQQQVAGRLFKALADPERKVRRPTVLERLCKILAVDRSELDPVLDAFRNTEVGFLAPPLVEHLKSGTVIDVSHECLIEGWSKFRVWIAEEEESARKYRRLVESTELFERRSAGYLSAFEVESLVEWKEKRKPNRAWAERYAPGFDRAVEYLTKSQSHRDWQSRQITALVALAFVATLAFLLVVFFSEKRARALAAANYWSLATKAKKAEEWLQASHYLARAVEETPGDLGLVYDSLLDLQRFNRSQKLGAVLTHDKPIRGAAFSPDQRQILTWGEDGQLKVWDSETGVPVPPTLELPTTVAGAAFRPGDGPRQVLGWSDDGTVKLWRLGSEQQPLELEHGAPLGGAVYNQDGSRILTWAYDQRVRIWSTADGTLLASIEVEGVPQAQFSPSGERILTWGTGGDPPTLRTLDGKSLQTFPTQGLVFGAKLGPRGESVLIWGNDGQVNLWKVGRDAGSKVLSHIEDPDLVKPRVQGATFSDDGFLILSWDDEGSVYLWSTDDGAKISVLGGGGVQVLGAEFLSRDKVLVWSEDGVVRSWFQKDGKWAERTIVDHDGMVLGINRNQSSDLLATWDDSGKVLIWFQSDSSKAIQAMLHEGPVANVLFRNDGLRILTWDDSSAARLWYLGLPPSVKELRKVEGMELDAREKRALYWSEVGGVEVRGLYDDVLHLRLSTPGGNQLTDTLGAAFVEPVIGEGMKVVTWDRSGYLHLWDIDEGSLEQTVFCDGLEEAKLSKSRRHVLGLGKKGALLWNLTGGEAFQLGHQGRISSADFGLEDGRVLLQGPRTISVWSTDGGAPVGPTITPDPADGEIAGAYLSPDQRYALSWGKDSVFLWEVDSGQPSVPAMKHAEQTSPEYAPSFSWVDRAIFSDNQRYILSWGIGGARLWDSETGKAIGDIMRHSLDLRGAKFSPDQDYVLTWGDDSAIRLWRCLDGQLAARVMKHRPSIQPIGSNSIGVQPAAILGAIFSADQQWILSWGADNTVRLWDLNGSLMIPPMHHESLVRDALFSSDQRLILTRSWEGAVRLWHTRDGSLAMRPLRIKKGVVDTVFDCDSKASCGDRPERRVLARSNSKYLFPWDISADYDFPVKDLQLMVETLSGASMNDLGLVKALTAEEWSKRMELYGEIAQAHSGQCRYREANLYLAFQSSQGFQGE